MTELSYIEPLNDQFSEFYETQWDVDDAYTITDMAIHFKIDIRHARYYLMKMVDRGLLCQVKWEDRTYYMHKYWAPVFKAFAWLGVRVL